MNMDKSFLSRLTFWKSVAIILITLGLYSVFIRFTGGLGAATNLSDGFPWGLWLGFNILCGVGLSAGGFTLCGIVYIFNLKDFKPLVRPAILTAFLGYLLVITALMIELGRPDKIWHTLIMWNPRSVMFEVAWCVMLYTTVLALEFSPIVLERLGWKTPLKIIKSITIPLVIAGVLLSTLHQSSLGSLYLIVPNKLYGLWYSELLPVFFFISALTVGCGMVIIESYLSSRTFKRELEFPLLLRLGQVMVMLIMVNLVVRFIDLLNRNAFDLLFLNRTETYLYWLEVFLGLIVPFIMMNFKKIRFNRAGLFYSALFVILGFILNRMNVSVTGMESGSGASYLPSWMEVFITMAIVSLGFVAFTLIGKYFPVFSEVHTPPNKNSQISKYKLYPVH
jgi:Ni/Fe-hydrogenase subunit HybB-like protein